MSNNKERALRTLINAFSATHHLSAEALENTLKRHDLRFSERSLSRWLGILRDEFDFEIKYDRIKECYVFTPDAQRQQPTSMLKYVQESYFLRDLLLRNRKVVDIIQPDNRAPLLNQAHFLSLIEACLENKRVIIVHQKFDASTPKKYELKPFFLKEYLYRWYLIAADTREGNVIKTFGLERIKEVEIGDPFSSPALKDQAQDKFMGLLGITGSEHNAIEIVLRTNEVQKNFFDTLPLHPKQKLEQIGEDKWEIRFIGKPNLELIQQIVSQREPIEVITPESFRKDVITFLEKNLMPYKRNRRQKKG